MKNQKPVLLAFAAHPDDVEFTSVITIKRFIEQGFEAYYIIATNGENGCKIPGLSKDKIVKLRKKEQHAAAKAIGVKKVIFLNYKDGFLIYDEKLRKKLTLLIKDLQPEIVFSFDPANLEFDNINLHHRDHREIALAVFDSCFAAKNDFIYPHKKGLHRVSKLYLYGSNKPDHFVNITKEMNEKMNIIAIHASQFSEFVEFTKFFKKNFASYTKRYIYSEAFRVVEIKKIT